MFKHEVDTSICSLTCGLLLELGRQFGHERFFSLSTKILLLMIVVIVV